MVERSEAKGLEKFKGEVESVEAEEGIEGRTQYHVVMKPIDIEVGGATGRLHEWIPMSPKATEETVPQGSVLDRYLTQVELVIDEAKQAKTVAEALNLMVGKKFQFKRVKLGKEYEGKPAREYSVPVQSLE